MMYYITDNDWMNMVLELLEILQDVQYDCIVGIPRSGLSIASYLSTMTAKPLSTPEKFLDNKSCWTIGKSLGALKQGYPNEVVYNPPKEINTVLLVEDDTGSGIRTSNMPEVKKELEAKFPKLKVLTAALIVTKHSKYIVDYYVIINDCFAWNSKLHSLGLGPKTTAVIILTKSIASEHFLKCYWHLVNNTTLPYQIVIVESHIKEYKYNYTRDINAAMKGIVADYYVLLNDDVYVEKLWLETFIATAKQDSKIGIIGALLLFPDGTIQHDGGILVREGDKRYFSHKNMGEKLKNIPSAHKQIDCLFVTGALHFITKECVAKIGYADSRYKISYMDVEYCLRAWHEGFRVVYQPGVKAVHEGSLTIKAEYLSKGINWYSSYEILLNKEYSHLYNGLIGAVDSSNRTHYPLPPSTTIKTPWTAQRIVRGGIRRTKRKLRQLGIRI